MYCKNCGRIVDDTARFCSSCGASCDGSAAPEGSERGAAFGFGVLGFLVPVAGFVLFLVFEKKKPKRAKSAGLGALIGAIIRTILAIILVVLYVLFGTALLKNTMGALGSSANSTREYISRYGESSAANSTGEYISRYGESSAANSTGGYISRYGESSAANSTGGYISRYGESSAANSTGGYISRYGESSAANNDVKVTFGEFKVTKDMMISNTSLDVTVTNQSDKMCSYYITVEATDGTGARIETDMVLADRLRPGQSVTLTAFEYVADEEIPRLQDAVFSVLDINQFAY